MQVHLHLDLPYPEQCSRGYWNVSIRILFDIPRNTRRYLIEPISRCLHIKTLLASRFVAFSERINSIKSSIRLLENLFKNDQRSVLCKNLITIADFNVLVDNCLKILSNKI